MGIILLDRENTCMCDLSTKCILGKVKSTSRCLKKEFEKEGYTAMNLEDVMVARSWLFDKPKRARIFSAKRNWSSNN